MRNAKKTPSFTPRPCEIAGHLAVRRFLRRLPAPSGQRELDVLLLDFDGNVGVIDLLTLLAA